MGDTAAALARLLGGQGQVIGEQVRDVHRSVADRVFRRIGPVGLPVRTVHDAIAERVHTALHSSFGAAGALAATVAGTVDDDLVVGHPRGRAVVGAVLGLIGDAIEDEEPALAWPTSLVVDGTPVLEVGAAGTVDTVGRWRPGASALVVLLHGLCETDDIWDVGARTGRPTLPGRLDGAGVDVVRVRCNSGRRPAELGRDVAALLEALPRSGPQRIVLVGHSMGGLVARAALREADSVGHAWLARCDTLITLGTPHLGAPLEKAVAVLVGSGALAGEVEAIVRWFEQRSAGIRDLRHGVDADDAPPGVAVRARPLPAHVRLHTVGAQVAPGAAGDLIGDGLVRRPSAHARSVRAPYTATRGEPLDIEGSHWALLGDDAVLHHVIGLVVG